MAITNAIPIIGPLVLVCNITTLFFCLRPKRGMFFTVSVYAAFTAVTYILALLTGILETPFATFSGVIFLPVNMWLFRGRAFQKVFAFFMPDMLTAFQTSLVNALVGMTIGYQSPYALAMFLILNTSMLIVHMALVIRFGRRLLERMFASGNRRAWAAYAFGAVFSCLLVTFIQWQPLGAGLYFGLIFFLLWSLGLLCFTIINTHEKAEQEHLAETLLLQIDAMRKQTEAESKHRAEVQILRHDMRHEAGVIMELYRTGKAAEAEAVYAKWRGSLVGTDAEKVCPQPAQRFLKYRGGYTI